MRSTKSKNQKEQIPSMQGRAAETNKSKNSSDQQPVTLNVVIRTFLFSIDGSATCEELLRDLLKAAIGGDKDSGTHSLLDVSLALDKVITITKFVRTLKNFHPSLSLERKKEIIRIAKALEKINCETFEEDIYRAPLWIANEEDWSLAALVYITRVANNFQNVHELIITCEELNREEGGASC